MKVFLVLALAVVVRSTVIRYAPAAAVVETGDSAQFRSEDNLGNYNFGYNEDHTSGGSFRREAGDAHGNVAGSYGLRDADGRLRIVNYVADDDGFRADIKTNEPGVEPKDPADVAINKGAAVVVESAAPAAVVAPAPVAAFVVEPAPVVSAPVAKSISTTTYTASAPAVIAQVPVTGKSAHVFPAPVAAPVAKTSTTTVQVAHAPSLVAPAPVVAKSAHVFPAPLSAPLAKTSTTAVEVSHAPTAVAFAEPAPIAVKSAYAFPPAAPVPVAKTATVAAVARAPAPIVYAEPAPYAVEGAVAFPPPAAVPVAKGAPVVAVASAPATVAIAQPAPLTYTSHVAIPAADQEPLALEAPAFAVAGPARYAAVDVGAPALTYSSPYAISAPVAPLSHSSQLAINHLALSSPAHYAHSYYAPRTLVGKSSGVHYAGTHSPLYYGLPSPAVSIVGASAYLNPYHFNGVTYVKK